MATLRRIQDFKSALAGGGARPNLFEVTIPNFPVAALQSTPGASWGNEEITKFNFMCKATNLPASNVASIDVPFRGRIFKVAGDRTIDNWTVTIINDEDFRLRTAFEAWMNGIAKMGNNTGATLPASYMAEAFVSQLGRGGPAGPSSQRNTGNTNASTATPALRVYNFSDIFPVNVSTIDLSYDSSDAIEEYTVEFAVNNIKVGVGPEGGAGDVTGVRVQ